MLVLVLAYLVGTFPTAQLVGRRTGHDPTTEGSHNPGATNVYRVAGPTAGLVVLVVDVTKGALPAAFGLLAADRGAGLAFGVAAVVGHCFPVTRRFRGGKGVATAAGVVLVLYPWVALGVAAVCALGVLLSRRVSVGSLVMAVALPAGVALAGRPWPEIVGVAMISACVIARHRENIARLMAGTEPPIQAKTATRGER